MIREVDHYCPSTTEGYWGPYTKIPLPVGSPGPYEVSFVPVETVHEGTVSVLILPFGLFGFWLSPSSLSSPSFSSLISEEPGRTTLFFTEYQVVEDLSRTQTLTDYSCNVARVVALLAVRGQLGLFHRHLGIQRPHKSHIVENYN